MRSLCRSARVFVAAAMAVVCLHATAAECPAKPAVESVGEDEVPEDQAQVILEGVVRYQLATCGYSDAEKARADLLSTRAITAFLIESNQPKASVEALIEEGRLQADESSSAVKALWCTEKAKSCRLAQLADRERAVAPILGSKLDAGPNDWWLTEANLSECECPSSEPSATASPSLL